MKFISNHYAILAKKIPTTIQILVALFILSAPACMIESPDLSDQTDASDNADAFDNADASDNADTNDTNDTNECFNGSAYVNNACEGLPQLALGSHHSCALLSDGKVKCWGKNTLGQLGRTTTNNTDHAPGYVDGITNAVSIASASDQTCIVSKDYELWCWGDLTGLPAEGSITNTAQAKKIEIPSYEDSNAIQEVELGFHFGCVRMQKNGVVQCWGNNNWGQLGRGIASSTPSTPSPVTSLNLPAVQLSSYGNHTCAVLNGGELKCWGHNLYGQLGREKPAGADYYATPITPVGLVSSDQVKEVQVGFMHTCILLHPGGDVKCWGGNSSGQLGHNDYEGRDVFHAKREPVLSRAQKLTTGADFSCALLNSRKVSCTGSNTRGQLGLTPSNPNIRKSFENHPQLEDIVEIQAGSAHICAVQSNGRILCWGDSTYGQITLDSTFPQHMPQQVAL